MHRRPHPGSIASLCLLGALTPLPAWGADVSADTEPAPRNQRFGDAGELAIAGASTVVLARTDATGGPSTSSFFVGPGVDWFPVRGLSLGVRVVYDHVAETGYPDTDALTVGPRVGYAVSLGPDWSIWPQVNASAGATWADGSRFKSLAVGGYVPLLYHPARHFFVGLGPSVSTAHTSAEGTSLPSGSGATTLGLLADVGGWVGL